MANRKVTININTTANTTGAQQATAAMTNLTNATNSANTATTNVGKGASKAGQLVGQAGYQIQDFAVQVGAGTSALTAFSQQAPQLLGAFGPAGAIAGAIVAIGAIATKVFLGMGNDAMSAEEKAKKLAETIENIGEAAAKAVRDEIDFGKKKIEDATTEAQQYADELSNVATNQLKLNKAVLDSLTEINEAEQILLELRGEATDALELQSEQAAADAARREAEMKILVAAEEQRLIDAQRAVEIQREELAEREKQKAEAEATLASKKEELKVAGELLKAAKELASQPTSAMPNQFTGFGATARPDYSQQRAASATLESGYLDREIEQLKKRVLELQTSVSRTGDLTKEVQAAENQVKAVESDLRKVSEDVKTSIESINLGAVSQDVMASAKVLEERAKILGDEVKSITEGVTASTAGEQAALATIKKKLNDGKVDLSEINETSAALIELGPRIRSAIDGNTQKVTQLITIMQEMQTRADQQQRRIDALQSRTPGTSSAR